MNAWKNDSDILHAAQYDGRYGGFSKGHLHVDRDDRLWLPLTVYFPNAEQQTDAWAPVQKTIALISEDKGLTWRATDQPCPGPSHNRVTMPDDAIVEVGGSGYLRYPRTEIERLEEDGYHVWDLGPENDYCAIVYGMWQKRSTDGGNTWERREIHRQLPRLAHFVARGPLPPLDDGSLVYLAHCCTPGGRIPLGGDPTPTNRLLPR